MSKDISIFRFIETLKESIPSEIEGIELIGYDVILTLRRSCSSAQFNACLDYIRYGNHSINAAMSEKRLSFELKEFLSKIFNSLQYAYAGFDETSLKITLESISCKEI